MNKNLQKKLLKLLSEVSVEETYKKLSQENRRIKRLKGLFFKNFPKGNQVFKKIWEEIMDEQQNKKQPFRASDTMKGLYNTFLRNDDQKRTRMSDQNNENQEAVENEDENTSPNETQNDELTALKTERDELRDQVLRKTAEMENIRRRAQKEKQDLIEYANERLLGNMIHLLDDLYMALEAAKKSRDYDALLKGIEMVYTKAEKAFDQAGVKPIVDHIGKPFDVNYHEALMLMPSDEPEGHVVQEVQRGYMLRDKVLRHAKVITSAGKGE